MRAARRQTLAAPPRPSFTFVHTDEQWDALASAPRQEILHYLGPIGPCSIAELARAMNAAADGLYHHVRRLLAAELIRDVGERHTGRRRERVYDLAGERLRFDVDIATGRNVARLSAILSKRLAGAGGSFDRAMRARALRLDDPIADAMMEFATGWLDDDGLARVLRHLQSAAAIVAAGRRARRGRLFSLGLLLNPQVRAREGATRPTKRRFGVPGRGAAEGR